MGMFEDIASGFVILMIGSLLWIAAGFLLDSATKSRADDDEPRSRVSYLAIGIGWLLLVGAWAYQSWTAYNDEPRDWLWIALAAAASLMALAVSIRSFRGAKQIA